MKTSQSLITLALLATNAAAFPTLADNEAWTPFKQAVQKRQAVASPQGAGALPTTPPPFDPAQQHVSTTGANAWVAPTSTDIRGECPGLNALANHGYLPHNGFATIQQFIDGTYTGLGMAQDLGGFLAVYGAIVDGNGAGWNIGGVPHTGILGSHGNYETDSSPLKSDLNQYGSNGKLIMSQFMNLYNRQPNAATANYNLQVMRDFRGSRFYESVNKNPYYYYGPFTGIAVSQAAFTFIYRFMANKSAENPEGILNKNTLKSFMSISGPENNLTWTPGHERIPDNFYKRHPSDSYSIPYFMSDIGYFAQTQPEIFEIGCNQGTVNSYSPFDVGRLTGGAYTLQSLAKNPVCFSAQFTAAGASALLGLSQSNVTKLQSALAPLSNSTGGCPAITNPDFSQIKACPGFSIYGGPTGQIAPGAVMS